MLNLLKLVLWPSIWCVLDSAPWAHEKSLYSAVVGWNVDRCVLGPIGYIIVEVLYLCVDFLPTSSVHY